LFQLRDLFRQEGVSNQIYLSSSAFWIVHRDAIDAVYELALGFWHKARSAGATLHVAAALGYAMQILSADPEAHLLSAKPDLWGSEELRGDYCAVATDAREGGHTPAILRLCRFGHAAV
jgi:hypothetical protein